MGKKLLILLAAGAAVLMCGHPVWFLLAVCIHEAGHLLGAILVGIPLRRMRMGGNGLSMEFAVHTASYGREAAVLLAGSLLGLFSAFATPLVCSGAYRMTALGLNLVNLLPIPGLDGGALLSCLLHRVTDGDTADRISRGVGLVAAVLFWAGGMWIAIRLGTNVTWLLCGTAAVVKCLREI